jgi:hypothetical protein
MRFLKTLTLNRRAIYDDRLAINTASEIIMNTTASQLVPVGTELQRTSNINGMIRYNADTKEFEGYQGGPGGSSGSGQWRPFRFKEPNGVILQDVGPADGPADTQTVFGPLKPDPFSYLTHQSDIDNPANILLYPDGWGAEQMAKNILVITETIVQLGTVNFEVVDTPSSTGTGEEITTGSFVPTVEYKITFLGDTDFTIIGASANTVGTIFTATGIGGGTTGLARQTGTYIEFYTAVPAGRSVHILHNMNQ